MSTNGESAWGLSPPGTFQQYFLMQGNGAGVSQTLRLPAGAYTLSFYAAARPYFRQSRFLVYMNDQLIYKNYLNTSWEYFTLVTFTVTSSLTTIEFTNEIPTGDSFDHTNFIDGVRLRTGKAMFK